MDRPNLSEMDLKLLTPAPTIYLQVKECTFYNSGNYIFYLIEKNEKFMIVATSTKGDTKLIEKKKTNYGISCIVFSLVHR